MGWFSEATGGIFDPISEPLSQVDDALLQPIVNTVKDVGSQFDDFVNESIPGGWTTVALLAAGAYYAPEIGAWVSSSGTPLATSTQVAAADATAGIAGSAGTGAGITAGSAGTGAGITAGSAGTGLTAGAGSLGVGTGSSGLGLTATQGAGTSLFAPAAGAGGLGLTAGSAGAGAIGAGLGLSSAAMGTGSLLGTGAAAGGAALGGAALGGAGAGALTASQLGQLGLIQGGLGLVGGLLQGNQTQDAMNNLASQQAALAERTAGMGTFQPVGITTRFGTSSFVTDPVTGAITPSYSLTPEAQAYQTSLAALGTQGLQAGQGMMNLGQQYIGESPEAVRQRYIQTQRATLAPEQEQQLARIRNNLFQTGRTGVATGATTAGGLAATNPEMAAYYNSLANTERQLAANAETQYQNQVNFGTGLLGSATTPFTNVFGAQKGVEAAAQQPLELSTNFANTVATRGAAQGSNYAAAMNPSLTNSFNAANYNPLATGLQGAASNPLVGYGLLNAFS